MKILMLGWELPPYHTGGLGVACYELCKALANAGVDIDFVVPYNDEHLDIDFMNVIPALSYSYSDLRTAGGIYDSKDCTIAEDPTRPVGSLRQLQVQYTEAVRIISKAQSYDAIHSHDWLTFEAAQVAKYETNKPLIAHIHSTEFDRSGGGYGNPLVHAIEYNALVNADKTVAVSQYTKDLIIREYAIPAKNIDVIHNSINPSEVSQPDAAVSAYPYFELMKQHGYSVVVNIGRLTIMKGLIHLLRAAKLVIDNSPNVLFLIAGRGEQFHELLELTAELGISQNVIFTGCFVYGKTWRDAYTAGDIFVLPSVSEPFGITALESIGYGAVPIISNQSGVSEVLSNVLKFDYWDTRRLADQILALVEHQSLRSEMYQNAHQEFSNLSWREVARKCLDTYNSIKIGVSSI